MRPEVKYLLECYMQKRFILADESAVPVVAERSSGPIIFNEKQLDDLILPEDVLRLVQHYRDNRNIHNVLLSDHQVQRIRMVATTLKRMSSQIHIRKPNALLSIENAVLLREGLNDEERRVIHRLRSTNSVSAVADCLSTYLTPNTFKASLRYLCYNASSASQELALVCELSQNILPHINHFIHHNFIWNIIDDFVEERLSPFLKMNS